ncbi:MAG: hypothetical protein B6I20_13920 [Bacteroidetes bacterium 4572_117]|nr:MAG: hypothetical protein B6I20_13920 [Bacteroidetes bacterium 4572_117]
MEQKKSISKRRLGVVITFISLFSIVSIFEYGRIEHLLEQNIILQITGIISLIVFIVSLTLTFIKTGLWKFTHKSLNTLDEREIILTSKSLRYAYAIFTVFTLFLLLSLSILGKPLSIVSVVSLIVFTHLLPASVIAWTERKFENK